MEVVGHHNTVNSLSFLKYEEITKPESFLDFLTAIKCIC